MRSRYTRYCQAPDVDLMTGVSELSGLSLDIEKMTKTPLGNSKNRALGRRAFLISGLAVLFAGGKSEPALAQLRRRRMRRIRRRALRRFRRRGGGLPDRARGAIRRGEIRPLRDVVARIRQRTGAEILDVDLHQRPQGWVYAVRVLTPNGRVRDVFVDGRSLDVLHFSDERGGDGVPLPPELGPSQPLPAPPRRNGGAVQRPPLPPPVRRPSP
ncbi:MAG: hypothetical protein K0U34_07195 [Alphaproteobacteria bacterium]|nr:hypothetical protein [Alphaproteobacteria bacterium]